MANLRKLLLAACLALAGCDSLSFEPSTGRIALGSQTHAGSPPATAIASPQPAGSPGPASAAAASPSPSGSPGAEASPSPSPPVSPSPTPEPKTYQVAIRNGFNPADLKIQTGEIVQWTNLDNLQRTLQSDQGLFSAQILARGGGTFSFTFAEPGTFTFRLLLSVLTVTVEPAPATPASPGAATPSSAAQSSPAK